MKTNIIFNPQNELWKKIKIVLRYLFSGGKFFDKIERHLKAKTVLDQYRREGRVFFRAYFMYMLPYVSKALSVDQKHKIMLHHYELLKEKFNYKELNRLFNGGISYYEESNQENHYQIVLQPVTSHLEFEGSMYLLFKGNDQTLFTLSFTFAPGSIFGYGKDTVIFISSIQGTRNEFENIRKATRYLKDNSLPLVLFKTLEAISLQMGINTCIGISAKNQLSFKNESNYEKFYNNYDAFWQNIGGICENGNYRIQLPLEPKPILQISQSHRNRTLKKRKKLDEIFQVVVGKNLDSFRRTA